MNLQFSNPLHFELPKFPLGLGITLPQASSSCPPVLPPLEAEQDAKMREEIVRTKISRLEIIDNYNKKICKVSLDKIGPMLLEDVEKVDVPEEMEIKYNAFFKTLETKNPVEKAEEHIAEEGLSQGVDLILCDNPGSAVADAVEQIKTATKETWIFCSKEDQCFIIKVIP